MIIEILVAQPNTQDPLAHQHWQGVFDQFRIALIAKASRQFFTNSVFVIHFAQQKAASVAGQMTSAEIHLYSAIAQLLKAEDLLCTLCHDLGWVWVLAFEFAIKV